MVYEGVAERLYGVSHALRNNVQYQQWVNRSRPEWLPIFNDTPSLNDLDLQETAPGVAQGPALLQGQDLDSIQGAAVAAVGFLGSLDVLRH